MFNKFDELAKRIDYDLFDISTEKKILHIIDDYNVNDSMSIESVEKLADAISSIKDLRCVKFYIQNTKRPKKSDLALLRATASTKIDRKLSDVERKLKIVELLKTKKINCSFVIYPYAKDELPFHGRYWLGDNKGYIVDGSICTADKKLVLVQLMDRDNYKIVRDKADKFINLSPKSDNPIYGHMQLKELYKKLETEKMSIVK